MRVNGCFRSLFLYFYPKQPHTEVIMFIIKNLELQHVHQQRPLIEPITMTLAPGMRLACVGEEGNGKSSFVQAIAGVPVHAALSVTYDTLTTDAVVGYVPQFIEAQGTLSEWFQRIEIQDYAQFYRLLDQFGLTDLEFDHRPFTTLSGGEQTKLAILEALNKHPDLLVLDEPTNNLDIESLEHLEAHLRSLPMPIVFVSHDVTFLRNVATHVLYFEQVHRRTRARTTLYSSGYDAFVETKDRAIHDQNKQAVKEKEAYDKAYERFDRVHKRVDHALGTATRQNPQAAKNLKDSMRTVLSQGKRLETMKSNMTQKADVEASVTFQFQNSMKGHASKVYLDFKNITLQHDTDVLVSNLSWMIVGAKRIAILGSNGVGKTTLLQAMREEMQSKGFQVGYMAQTYDTIFDTNKTAFECICTSKEKDAMTRAQTYLGSLNFTYHEMHQPFAMLSGGQKAKLFFGMLSLQSYDVLLLDEPTRNISPLSHDEFMSALKQFNGLVVCVTHDRTLIEGVMDEVYRLTEDGLFQEFSEK